VDGLTPKAKIQSYCEHDYDDLLEVLKKNKEKLGISPSNREASELLKDEFE
jgi:hypothetical protein